MKEKDEYKMKCKLYSVLNHGVRETLMKHGETTVFDSVFVAPWFILLSSEIPTSNSNNYQTPISSFHNRGLFLIKLSIISMHCLSFTTITSTPCWASRASAPMN